MDEYFKEIIASDNPPVYKAYLSGEWKSTQSGKFIDIISPIDGVSLGKVPIVSKEEIEQTINSAHIAQKEWRQVSMIKRTQVLHIVADLLRHHEGYLTMVLMSEIGKTQADAKDEILRSADMIDFFANEALNIRGEEITGDQFPGYDQSKMAIIEKVPIGVILAIGPFNYPVNLSVSKLAPALVCGNAVIFKPPTQGSISDLHLVELFRKAGLPPGLLSTIIGGASDLGDTLITHPGVDMISFTGSSEVGKMMSEKAGMIPLQFECGGNNPAIVLPDADKDLTASEIVKGFSSYAGQRCTAIKYVLGLKPVLDQIIPLVAGKIKESVKLGNPKEEGITMGPVISEKAAQEIEKKILSAKEMGAEIIMGGNRNGCYIEPTVLKNVTMDMDIVKTETFGPTLCFVEVESVEKAIHVINNSTYGLQASIFTSDEGTAIAIGRKLDVGTIQVNSKPQRGPDHFPFLGVKGSGVGVQGIRYTLDSMMRPRPIVLNKPG